MPPKKRKAAQTSKAGKKVKLTDEEPSDYKKAADMLNAQSPTKNKPDFEPDLNFPQSNVAKVYKDYSCMLNQTNIGNNNNKFYIIQILVVGKKLHVWNRWGRVGEDGQSADKTLSLSDDSEAVKMFEKKFQDKTKNKWVNRENFVPASGKYTMIEIEKDDETKTSKVQPKVVYANSPKCTLNSQTQSLMELIFNTDMMRDAMTDMDIDVNKMPLGKLSKSQIAKGFTVLEKLENLINKGVSSKKKTELESLSSEFYTIIPHSFGRGRPPVISTSEMIRTKMDMLLVLGDIELAQSITADTAKSKIHPADENYQQLNCDLELLDKKSQEFKHIQKYSKMTGNNESILNVWKMSRHGEEKRFSVNDKIHNRKLLWHGTNVAVVAAILKSGLRIMPHSGGRVGKGIYFASEMDKSSGYVWPVGNIGIMFLNEVALGKEHHIKEGNSTLKVAPKGFDSIVAKGITEPDPSQDIEVEYDGHKVVIPQGKPTKQISFSDSSFYQSEYLIYREDQCRMRYLLEIDM